MKTNFPHSYFEQIQSEGIRSHSAVWEMYLVRLNHLKASINKKRFRRGWTEHYNHSPAVIRLKISQGDIAI